MRAVVALCLLLGAQPAAAAGAKATDPPSVLLITIDTLRRDRLGCYGSSSCETPHLDALARTGTLFETVVTSAPTTAPSHATMMTALSPRAHGVLANGQTLAPHAATLAEALRDAGYATGAFVSSAVLARRAGLDRGFDDYIEAYSRAGTRQSVSSAESTNAHAIPWLRAHAREPFFLWVHYYDPHQPYEAPGVLGEYADAGYAGAMPEWDDNQVRDWIRSGDAPAEETRHLRARYDAEVAYVDAQVGALLAALDATGAQARTLVCVTSDHGETLGEHAGYFGHSHQLYDTTLLVPLIVSLPGRLPARGIVAAPARLLDLAPTLLAILERAPLANVEGRSLLAIGAGMNTGARSDVRGHDATHAIDDEVVGSPSLAVSETHPSDRPGPDVNVIPRKLSMRSAEGKLIRWLDSDSLEVFDLARDPGETRNLAADAGARTSAASDDGGAAALTTRLSERLAAWEKAIGAALSLEPLDEETRERLRSLGYID
ncbi:MAG: sulfatase [bacterium]